MTTTDIDARTAALQKLREKFPDENIGKLPKVNCWNCNEAAKRERGTTCPRHAKTTCRDCGNYLTTGHMHIEYVGHAEATDRFLDVDLTWNWRPMALTAEGLPLFDNQGGMWIYLTIGGVERLGYGNADGKTGANAIKEIIGDALRNAGMRFGVALDQWAKTDLHAHDDDTADDEEPPAETQPASTEQINTIVAELTKVRGVRDRDGARQAISSIIGHPIASARELTTAEADEVLERLRHESQAKPEPATGGQITMLNTLLGKRGLSERNARLAWLGERVGRQLGSSKDLAKAEASRIIDELDTEQPKPDSPADAFAARIRDAKSSEALADVSEQIWQANERHEISDVQASRLIDLSMEREAELSGRAAA